MRRTREEERKLHGTAQRQAAAWDHSSHEKFYEYYAKESLSPETLRCFSSLQDMVLRVPAKTNSTGQPLDVADIGCGAGTQCLLWAERGHRVHGIDVNQPLVELAKERIAGAGYTADLRVGSAAALPWPDESVDICLAIELLEHVPEWRSCLKEFSRVLRPGGVLLLTTTNKLCPVQEEFSLPLYSCYPSPVKRYCERLARTSRPQFANYARYPPVNWFSFYGLKAELTKAGFDRFDVTDRSVKSTLARWIILAVPTVALLRWLAHVATPGTLAVAIKRAATQKTLAHAYPCKRASPPSLGN